MKYEMDNAKDRKIRAVNVDPEIWEKAKAKAASEGKNVSWLVRNALAAYVAMSPEQNPEE